MILRPSILFALLLFCSATFAQKIKINVLPSDATIYIVLTGGEEKAVGNGFVQIKATKEEAINLVFRKPGYKPIFKSYQKIKGIDLPKTETIELKDRMVIVSAEPNDAQIFANGVAIGTKKVYAYIPENDSLTLEVTKPGYRKKSKIYYNQANKELPPVNDFFVLEDRVLQVKLSPSDAQIVVDGIKLPDGANEIIIPAKSCVSVAYKKEGYVTIEKSYCVKEEMPEIPLFETVILKDRLVRINTTPNDAIIKVDGKPTANGAYSVKVLEGTCVEVTVEKPGFASVTKNYCNQLNMQPPLINDTIVLNADEAYALSIQSDQANMNFSITVGSNKTLEDSWKMMNQMVTSYFDVIEMADKETSYLRTEWSVKNFPNNTIRTRIIVKPGSGVTAQYIVKIQSEASGAANTSAKDDEKFKEWDRLLNAYKDVISEMQTKFK